MKAMVLRTVNATREHKYHVNFLDTGVINSANWILNCLTLIPQGNTANSRDGRNAFPTSLQLKYWVGRDTSATAPRYEVVRVIVFVWHVDDNTAPPTIADVLESTGSGQRLVNSAYKQKPTNGFTVLHDQRIGVQTSGSQVKVGSANLTRLPRITFETGGALFGKNHVYLLLASDNPQPLPDGSALGYTSTCRFTDA
jgi:hypothetical protein